MTRYNSRIGQGKLGVNLIRSFTDENKCYFNEIKQENDVGIDAIIEFTKNGENNGKCIAVQIKTGSSYFNKSKTKGIIPIGSHYGYWETHSLDVYGIVCDCNANIAYWVNIKNYLKTYDAKIKSGSIKSITFPLMQINKIDKISFETVFKNIIYGFLPDVSYAQAIAWTYSKFVIEKTTAIKILATEYANCNEVWDRFFEMFREETDYAILSNLIYYISYMPHHADLWGSLNFSVDSKTYATNLIKSLDISLIEKLLSLIDENGIERGTIGQSVESIINIVPNKERLLQQIIEKNLKNDIAEFAFYILAYYDIKTILKNTDYYITILGDTARIVINYYRENGFFDLYA